MLVIARLRLLPNESGFRLQLGVANFAQRCKWADGFGADQAVQDRGLATGDGPFIRLKVGQ